MDSDCQSTFSLIDDPSENEGSSPIIHIPAFLKEYNNHELHPPEKSKNFLFKLNWITSQLQLEIDNCSPSKTDIDRSNENVRNSESFVIMFNKLFPVNCQFASHVQLGQVVSQFSELWAFGITKSGQAIQCHFGQPTYKKRGKNIRKHDESMKDCIKCPFKINYSLIGKKNSIRKRVTNGNSGISSKGLLQSFYL